MTASHQDGIPEALAKRSLDNTVYVLKASSTSPVGSEALRVH